MKRERANYVRSLIFFLFSFIRFDEYDDDDYYFKKNNILVYLL
jgi:hypothetical protein